MNIFHIFFLVPSSPDLQIEIIANVKLRFKKSSSSLKSRAPPLYIGMFAYVKKKLCQGKVIIVFEKNMEDCYPTSSNLAHGHPNKSIQ
jgi:hypothetical protein